MVEPVWDQNIQNAGAAIDSCMKMGAVILKPKGSPTSGFQKPDPRV